MLKPDATVKFLLAAIAMLLAVIAFRPMFQITPEAQAQNTLPGLQTVRMSQVAVDTQQPIQDVLVMDHAKCFLVCYNNRIDVYRVIDEVLTQYK